MRVWKTGFAVIWWGLALSAAASAQTGTIGGSVVNLRGGPVPKAEIQATNAANKAVVKATTSAEGKYTLTLPAGTYQLSSNTPGFEPFIQQGLAVSAGKTTAVNIRLHDFQLNTLGDGREYFALAGSTHPKVTGPTPRLPNGKPDLSGVWWAQFTTDPGKPELKPAAAAILRQREDTLWKDFPQSFCQPLGVLLSNMFTTVWRAVQTPQYMVMISEGDTPGYRQFFLDGRAHPKDLQPTWIGHSVGRWDGDTLVVDTVGFNDRTWLPDNVPHSEKMHLTERYRRPDLGHLEIEFTIADSEAFVRPWVIKRVADLAPAEEVTENICTENERDRAHLGGK